MARRYFSILQCVTILSVGLAIGGHLSHLRITSTANAKPELDRENYIPPSAESLLQSGQHIARVSRQVMPAAVHIQAIRTDNGRKVEETGSGVLMRSTQARGLYVITNNHVVRGADSPQINVTLATGEIVNPTRVFRDGESDLAVLQVADKGQPTGRWGDSNQLEIGHFVLAVGSPFGLSQSVTMGIVSAKGRRDLSLTEDRTVINQDFIQTDAAINPGNSGGPLIDMHGMVVGINTAIASNSGGNEGIGFSIPSNLAHRVFEQLVTHGKVRRAYLGVELDSDFTDEAARRLGLPRATGARITRVYSQSTPAALAGLKADDVILTFNGVVVQDENHLINLVSLAD
ncbi:MAG: trypsin-like peptidase domain-containing protein, partial [Planctomycetaceae bacterium]|nr:trypsin-like peptidase domain-containing protein [Planctomycetaceae bacterium]